MRKHGRRVDAAIHLPTRQDRDADPAINPPDARGRTYQFVELGRGRVDLPAVFKALKDVKFTGWCVVELDGVPDPSRTPKECAQISKDYLEKKIGLKV